MSTEYFDHLTSTNLRLEGGLPMPSERKLQRPETKRQGQQSQRVW